MTKTIKRRTKRIGVNMRYSIRVPFGPTGLFKTFSWQEQEEEKQISIVGRKYKEEWNNSRTKRIWIKRVYSRRVDC